ncbi:hypothetical protein PCANC_24797 [Puccinia coronata f. sp. avenae]|uniref:No apical meristem-associated C-terminal domain-containing protein n=1 Tax=Puccinia coronata f. sp. avenae TaxID=200324 RepID=A0A2N5TQC4_9BASI|nr:hypothetical protein PCANC_24797 [Puccinia coronata f. sp. avenae]
MIQTKAKLAKAKELYRTTHKLAFNLDHCWAILTDAPKWQATQEEYKLKIKRENDPKGSKPTNNSRSVQPQTYKAHTSSPLANHADDKDNNTKQSLLGSKNLPQGQKAEKRKHNDNVVLNKVLNAQEELIRISNERMLTVKNAMKSAKDHRVMSMDLTNMDEESKAYW